jgi:hypothetical protein
LVLRGFKGYIPLRNAFVDCILQLIGEDCLASECLRNEAVTGEQGSIKRPTGGDQKTDRNTDFWKKTAGSVPIFWQTFRKIDVRRIANHMGLGSYRLWPAWKDEDKILGRVFKILPGRVASRVETINARSGAIK